MSAYSFSPVRKYALVGAYFTVMADVRISVSHFTENASGRLTIAVALERRDGNRWVIDSDNAFEVTLEAERVARLAGFCESEAMDRIHRAVTGSFLPMGHSKYEAPR